MLVYIGQGDVAAKVHNAWLKTIEDGIHTYDIFDPAVSSKKVGTKEFADAVIENLGKYPQKSKSVNYLAHGTPLKIKLAERPVPSKELVGVDVFVDWRGLADELGKRLEEVSKPEFQLVMITNRGTKVYPDGIPETFCVDHWRCRFQSASSGQPVTHRNVVDLLGRMVAADIPPIKTEGLFTFDGKPGFSLGQGQ